MAHYSEDMKKPEEVVHFSDVKEVSTSCDNESQKERDYVSRFIEMSVLAQASESQEKQMTLKEGLKTFPTAVLWSVVLSTAIIMEGFDTALLNSLYNQPSFQKNYGEYFPEINEYQISAKWQTSLSMAVNVGEIIGLWLAGIIAELLGYRRTLISAMVLGMGFIFIIFFSTNIEMLLVGEILTAIVWGAFQTLTVSYASEVCPVVLRVYLTTYVNACWVIGQLIASITLRLTLNMSNQWAYKIPFALQWVWPVPIIIGIYLAPESPWWLCKKRRIEEASDSIRRLLTKNKNMPDTTAVVDAMLSKIQLTIEKEKAMTSGSSYLDCFKGTNWRRTRIASLIWVIQNITGSALIGFSAYFYTQAGLSRRTSFTFSIIQYSLGLVGTLCSWILSQRFGRFQIFYGGLLLNFTILTTIGGLGFSDSKASSWAAGSLLLVFTFIYDSTVGPITYCVVAELPSVQLRAKTLAIARNMYNISGIPVAIITPYMLNPTAWNWKAKTGLFWSGFALMGLIWAWFEFPETDRRTYAELNALFEAGTKARKFKATEVDPLRADTILDTMSANDLKNLTLERAQMDKEKV